MLTVVGIIAYLVVGVLAIRFRVWRPFTFLMVQEDYSGYQEYYHAEVYYVPSLLFWPLYLLFGMLFTAVCVVMAFVGAIVLLVVYLLEFLIQQYFEKWLSPRK